MTDTNQLPPHTITIQDHPEPHIMQWSDLELAAVKRYAEQYALQAIALRPQPQQPATTEPVLFIHPDTFAMNNAHVGAWKPGHELTGYIPLYRHPAVMATAMLTAKEGTNGEIN